MFKSPATENKLLRGLIKSDQVLDTTNVNKAQSAGLSADCFTSDFRSWLYSTIVKYSSKYAVCITDDICKQRIAKKYRTSESINDSMSLFSKIMSCKFDNDELEALVDDVKKRANLRHVTSLSLSVAEKLKDMESGAVEFDDQPILNEITNVIDRINHASMEERIIEENAFLNVKADMDILRDLRDHPEKYKGITTGIEPLDIATNGWHGGELITVIGRTGQGKSIVLLNFATAAWRAGYNVMYVTIEMPIEQQKRRLHSKLTGTPYQKFKDPQSFSDEEMDAVEARLEELNAELKNELVFLDAPSLCTAKFIEKRVHNWQKKTGKKIELLVVDPIYLMQANEKDDDNVGAVSWDLKLLARKLDIPIINANQINREGHKRHQAGKEIDAMDSANSDKLGQNSDVMLGIFSDDELWVKMTIVKYRDGNGPVMFLRRNYDRMSVDYDPDYGGNEAVKKPQMAAATASPKDKDSDDGLDE